jgi:hypothetical protein
LKKQSLPANSHYSKWSKPKKINFQTSRVTPSCQF